jgi:hypothetical protein
MAYVETGKRGKTGVFEIKGAHSDNTAAISRFMESCGVSGHTVHSTSLACTYLVEVKRVIPQKSGVQIHTVPISTLFRKDNDCVKCDQAEALKVAIGLVRPLKSVGETKKKSKARSKAA